MSWKKQICFYLIVYSFPFLSYAQKSNPDLSAIGQLLGGWTDDANNPDNQEPALKLGEAEIILEAPLNPYFKGLFTLSAGDEGVAVEEAYVTMIQGLPWGLAIKAGKYRLGFGKMNAMHPHVYSFIEPPRSMVSLLPGGDEGFNEAALQISDLLPTPGDWASTVSVDLIEGKQFHPDYSQTHLGWLGRWSNNFLFSDAIALESGLSFASGKDIQKLSSSEFENALIWGTDLKIKFFLPQSSQLTFQAEGILNQGHRIDTTNLLDPKIQDLNRFGFLTCADFRYHNQFNGGLLFERWKNADLDRTTDMAIRVFIGYAVLEESTLFRFSMERMMPENGKRFYTGALQMIFRMGPHKAHGF